MAMATASKKPGGQEFSRIPLPQDEKILKSMLKATEDMVAHARLNQIAREHRSIGSILDDRLLHRIEEPKRRSKKTAKVEVKKRQQGRRGGKASDEIQIAADNVIEGFKEKGINLTMHTGNYSLEEQIHREKSGPATYSQKRRFQYPELQKFKEGLNSKQKLQFKERVKNAIVELADRYRDECRALKVDMDINGIFHPEANAHRVHCIYLMKLYKGITADNIEDPILRRMRVEEEERQEKERQLNEQKAKLLKAMEEAEARRVADYIAKHGRPPTDAAPVRPNDAQQQDAGDALASASYESADSNASEERNIQPTTRASMSSAVDDHGILASASRDSRLASRDGEGKSRSRGPSRNPSFAVHRVPTSDEVAVDNNIVLAASVGKLPSSDNAGKSAVSAVAGISTEHRVAGQGAASKAILKASPAKPKPSHEAGMAEDGGEYGFVGHIGRLEPIITRKSVADTNKSATQVSKNKQMRESKSKSELLSRSMPASSGLKGSKSLPKLQKTGGKQQSSNIVESKSGSGGSSLLKGSAAVAAPSTTISPERSAHMKEKNEKLFKKIKRDKLGASNPSELLPQEAERLERGDILAVKKQRDKNNIVDTDTSSWMLSSVQKHQIVKTATGAATLTTGNMSNYPQPPGISATILKFNDALKQSSASPTKMLPFQEFYQLFEDFSKQEQPPETQQTLEQMQTRPGSSTVAIEGSVERQPSTMSKVSKDLQVRFSSDEIPGVGEGVIASESNNALQHHGEISSNDPEGAPVSKVTIQRSKVGSVNIVKAIADLDPQFENFLKVKDHSREARLSVNENMRNRLNTDLAKPKKLRKVNPLGKDAMILIDSRGRESKDSKKGFVNLFVAPTDKSDDSTTKVDDEEQLTTDDLIGRLQRAHKKEEDQASESSVDISSVHSIAHEEEKSFNASNLYFPPSDSSANRKLRLHGAEKQNNSATNSVTSEYTCQKSVTPTPSVGGTARVGSRSRSRGSGRHGVGAGIATTSDAYVPGMPKQSILLDDDADYEIPPVDPDDGFQEKIVAAWETLLVPASTRLSFMRKYSTDEFSMEMTRAVDIWSEAAVYVVAINEIAKVLTKIKAGTCVMPLKNKTVVRNIHRKIPPLLASSSQNFIPPTLGYYDARKVKQMEPLSTAALRRVERAIDHGFRHHYRQMGKSVSGPHGMNKNRSSKYKSFGTLGASNSAIEQQVISPEYEVSGAQHANDVMKSALTTCIRKIKDSVKLAQEELGDLIPYGGKWCKEWLFELSLAMGVRANNEDGENTD